MDHSEQSDKSALKRYEELCAKFDCLLLVHVMELDFRLSELERDQGDATEYSMSLSDHPGNLCLLEQRLDQLETKLLTQPKPN